MVGAEHAANGSEQRTASVVVVEVGGRPLALLTRDVLEVQPIVFVSPLPHAPAVVEGVIDARGHVVAVLDLGPRFGAAPRTTRLDDLLVLVATARRRLALHVGAEVDVRTIPWRDLDADLRAEAPYAHGLVVLPDDLVVLHDVDAFLSTDDEVQLATAVDRQREPAT